MTIRAPWTRETLIDLLRLLHLAEAASQVVFELPVGARWKGDRNEGEFRYSSGTGDDLAAVWDSERAVVVAFEHESERSAIGNDLDLETAGEPRANFDPPETYEDLVQRAAKLLEEGDQNVTAGAWAAGEDVLVSEPYADAFTHGLNWVDPFPSQEDELRYLVTSHSMSEAKAALVQSLVKRAPCALSDAERILLLEGERPGGEAAASELLRQIGITWG